MRNDKGQFTKGHHFSPETEFKKGQHWRPKKPYWDKDWLVSEYATKERSANDIASEFGITEAAILYWLRKHNILRREMSNIRSKKHWGLAGEQNGMYGRTGENSSNWKGGITPDRQKFYISDEWKKACSEVYKRDNAQCQRCGNKDNLHVHHIVTFANKELRADIDNLVLLCAKCHRFVHSKKNNNREYTREDVQGC